MKKGVQFSLLAIVTFLINNGTLIAGTTVSLKTTEDTTLSTHSNLGGGSSPRGNTALWVISEYSMLPGYGNHTFSALKWNLSGFSGATVLDVVVPVKLYLGYTWYYGGGTSYMDISLHKSLVSWHESNATYNNFGGDVGLQSNEYLTTAYDSERINNNARGWFTWYIPGSLVQEWIDNPTSNNGLLLLPNGTNRPEFMFHSNSSGSNEPTLTFEYIPEPMTLLLMGCGVLPLMRKKRK